MTNVVPLSGQISRCCECRLAVSCPLVDESDASAGPSASTRIRVAHDQDRIHRAGDPMETLYRIRIGTVKTSLTVAEGEEQVTGFYGPGDWLGLESLHDSRHRSDAIALETVSVCVTPVNQLLERMNRSPRAAHLVVDALGQRIARKERLHLTLARDGAMPRLAGFLLDLCESRDGAGLDSERVSLPMSRAEMASYLALAVETVSRLLTRMQQSGAIEVHRHHLQILDRPALAAIAGRGPSCAGRTSTSARN